MSFDHTKYQPFPVIDKPDRRWPSQRIEKAPLWAAVDLRDGNQALIKPMSVAQKRTFFQMLVELGFKEIEVGFPSASQIDFDFCRALIEEDLVPDDVHIQVLTQAREDLIARTFESLKGAKNAIVHIYNATSPTFREQVFNVDKAGCKTIAVRAAEWVRDFAAQQPDTHWSFQYSPETFSATETDFAIEVIDAVNAVWRPDQGQRVIINLPATVEVSTPNVFADQVELVHEKIQYRDDVIISVHTHDDRGCGVAAAEMAVMAGADRVEGTLLGNGERTGNMDLVTAGMNLYSQGIDPQIDFSRMKEIVALVEEITDIQTHPRHPYAGDLVFSAFSGSHQDAIRKCLARYQEGDIWNVAYLPIDPADVGRRYEEVVRINSQSGKGGVAHVLERDFGIDLPRWLQQELAKVVQQDAEEDGGEITSERVHRRFNSDYLSVPMGWVLRSYDLNRSNDQVQAQISIGDNSQPVTLLSGRGDGAMSALVDALNRRIGGDVKVVSFDEYSLGDNTEANAMACVRVQVGETVQSAVATAADTTAAALQAILSAVGRVQAAAEVRDVVDA
ncbi:2-isopropylmalate synthase [Alcanivorax sp. P2S70]|uniref:2-isopropylmalate synthase n=1 Tax=Alcanivorax profundi TaxID=2338368 RepID=A0A418XYC4_9GAMM|nr:MULTISPECIES: 2-isopropylmalate synthase [Alcanivorax]ERP90375.1 2-isopropylmalate synthase [Alcanivorax sp. P2S70]RJG18031.1 2-isopropylmalate synthase [Alcanivorax profundi]